MRCRVLFCPLLVALPFVPLVALLVRASSRRRTSGAVRRYCCRRPPTAEACACACRRGSRGRRHAWGAANIDDDAAAGNKRVVPPHERSPQAQALRGLAGGPGVGPRGRVRTETKICGLRLQRSVVVMLLLGVLVLPRIVVAGGGGLGHTVGVAGPREVRVAWPLLRRLLVGAAGAL